MRLDLILVNGALIIGNDAQKGGFTAFHVGGGRDADASTSEINEANGLDAVANANGRWARDLAACMASGVGPIGVRLLPKEFFQGNEALCAVGVELPSRRFRAGQQSAVFKYQFEQVIHESRCCDAMHWTGQGAHRR